MASICVASRFDFTRSGYLYIYGGYLGAVGNGSYSWSNLAYANVTSAYYLSFGSGNTYVSYNNTRPSGYSMRCIVDNP